MAALSAKRGGSLVMHEPRGPGRRCPTEYAYDETSGTRAAALQRYEPWLRGGEVPRVDCGTTAGFRRACDRVRRRLPVVMENLRLLPATSGWTVGYLREHTSEWPGMHVLRSARGANRYLYYVPDHQDRDTSAYSGAPRHACSDLHMSFRSFCQAARDDTGNCYYLQAPLLECSAATDRGGGCQEKWCKALDGALRADCGDRRRLEAVQAAGDLGQLNRSQLFVGPQDTLSAAHYDQVDNLYLQVRGRKHFLVFDPRAAEGLYPFPACHPHDRHAMVDLERVDTGAFPGARACLEGRGAAAELGPGDCLFLPSHWWHHVQGGAASPQPRDEGLRDSEDSWCIGLNFWFNIQNAVVAPLHPFLPHIELELARHAELMLADACGSAALKHISAALAADLDDFGRAAGGKGAGTLDIVSLPVRNLLLFRLARLLGAEAVAEFVRTYLDPQRFSAASAQHALEGHGQSAAA